MTKTQDAAEADLEKDRNDWKEEARVWENETLHWKTKAAEREDEVAVLRALFRVNMLRPVPTNLSHEDIDKMIVDALDEVKK